jgi:hypothetical protein
MDDTGHAWEQDLDGYVDGCGCGEIIVYCTACGAFSDTDEATQPCPGQPPAA